MKLFKLSIGLEERYGVAVDEKDMYERRAEVDHTYYYLPVLIEEVAIPGYIINVVEDTEGQGELDLGDSPKNRGGRPRKAV